MTNWERHKEQMMERQERPQPVPEPKGVVREMSQMQRCITQLTRERDEAREKIDELEQYIEDGNNENQTLRMRVEELERKRDR